MKPILVTGATGKQGGATARQLLARGFAVRAMTRNPSSMAARELSRSGAEVVFGDLDDEASLRNALRGADGVFSVQSYAEHGAEGEVRQGEILATLAARAGISHFIYCSVGGAERHTGVHHFQTKWRIEEHIGRLELPATILRPVALMESFTFPFFLTMVASGILPGPQKPGDRCQFIAAADVGRIAAEAFALANEYIGAAIEIASDEMTLTQAAAVFARVLGRPVKYVELGPADLNEELRVQMGGFTARGGFSADVRKLREKWPWMFTLENWLRATGWDRLQDMPATSILSAAAMPQR